MGFDYKIEYKSGSLNRGADALSRKPELNFIDVSHPCSSIWAAVQEEVLSNPFYLDLPSTFPITVKGNLVRRDGVWFRKNVILLSSKSPLLSTVVDMCRSSFEGCHFGFHKTLAKIYNMQPAGLL